jgi:hypothetical protein
MKTNSFILVLRKALEHNKERKEILSFFVNGLGAIHEKILDFMVKHSEGVKGNDFQGDYESLFGALSKRIEYEEKIPFLEYEMLNY